MIDRAQMDPSGQFDPKDPRMVQRARMWATRRTALARMVADLQNGASTARDVPPRDERKMWHQRGITPEEALAKHAEGYTPEQVAQLEFPNRYRMVTASGRKDDPEAQYDYALRMSRLGPPDPADALEPALAGPTEDMAVHQEDLYD